MQNDVWREIHEVIHDPNFAGLEIDGVYHPVQVNKKKNLRFMTYQGRVVIQQNPNTGSKYAKRARDGEKISWVIKGDQYERVIEG